MAAKEIKRTNKAKKKKKAIRKSSLRTASQTEQTITTPETQPKQTLMPYDENLLERSRTQWQFGDWESLVELNRDTLQHHPDRAKLALLAAAGRLQTGNDNDIEARQFIRLAQDWGIDKKLVSRVLIAGIHNNLGRAAAIVGQKSRALSHFEKAISVGAPGSATRLLTQARINEQFQQLGLSTAGNSLKIRNGEVVVSTRTQLPINQSIEAINTIVLKQQKKEFIRMSDTLGKMIKKEVTNIVKQLEAFSSIQSYFESGQVLGELHGWPISPDLALYLIRQLEIKEYDFIIEFGSGTSTQLIARTLAMVIRQQPTRTKPIQVAFEHLERFYQKSQQLLQHAGVVGAVSLYFTPLKPYVGPDNIKYYYYDCEHILNKLAATNATTTPAILALVDGPPGGVGPNARYPALPLLLKYFPYAEIDVILDDFNRTEEKEVVNKWQEDLKIINKTYEVIEEELDKGACFLTIQ